MTKGWFTAGRASGATDIPLVTMRRYVNEFSEHFSESARISSRGRRYSDKDIELLLKIRLLYGRGLNQREVAKVLDGNWDPEGMTQREIGQAALLIKNAAELHEKAETVLRNMRSELQSMDHNNKDLESKLLVHIHGESHSRAIGRTALDRLFDFASLGLVGLGVLAWMNDWQAIGFIFVAIGIVLWGLQKFGSD